MDHRRYQVESYVEFQYPSSYYIARSIRRVKTRDASRVKEVPEEAFGFRFFDILFTTVTYGGQRVKMASVHVNVSPLHYYGGEICTVAEIRLRFPRHDSLLRQFASNDDAERVIWCRKGGWELFGKDDVLVEAA